MNKTSTLALLVTFVVTAALPLPSMVRNPEKIRRGWMSPPRERCMNSR